MNDEVNFEVQFEEASEESMIEIKTNVIGKMYSRSCKRIKCIATLENCLLYQKIFEK